MGEPVCVGFASARGFWRGVGHRIAADNPASDEVPTLLVRILFQGGPGIDLGSMPKRSRHTGVPARVATAGVATVRAGHPELGDVVDVCVSTQAARHEVRSARVHLVTGRYPTGSLYRVREGAVVVSPELCFLQAASELDVDLLVAYGYELCGLYARDGAGTATFANCPALTTRARISSYLDRLEALRDEDGRGLPPGVARARRALARVRDRAASPEEAVSSMVLTYPRRLGGFGLPEARMNERVRLGAPTSRLFGIDSFVCDISWNGGRNVVEYQGSQHKSRSRASYDMRKGNVLVADGRMLTQLDAGILKRQDRMEEVAKAAGRGLGIRWREPSAEIRLRQILLRGKLLKDLGM